MNENLPVLSVSESRIMNTEEIKDIKEFILCGICYQVITEDKGPVECNQCHNQLFCSQCIQAWVRQNPNCPYCHGEGMFVDVSPILLNLMKEIKYCCKYKDKGCKQIHKYKELAKHEAKCTYNFGTQQKIDQCRICNEDMFSYGSTFIRGEIHYCDKEEKDWCNFHKTQSIFFPESRISNLEEVRKYVDIYKCSICSNLLRSPQTCFTCKKNFCKSCISNTLILNNHCPSCFTSHPEFTVMPRNLQSLLNKFQIKCKNQECQEILQYDQIQKHEKQCDKCKECVISCTKCNSKFQGRDKIYHKCPDSKTNKQQIKNDTYYELPDSPEKNGNHNTVSNEEDAYYRQMTYKEPYCRQMRTDIIENISNCNTITVISATPIRNTFC